MKIPDALTFKPMKHAEPVEKTARDLKLKETSKELESVFLTHLFKVMEKTIPKDNTNGSNNNLSTMMFSSVMGESLANQGGIGLSDMIYTSLADNDEIPDLNELKQQIYFTQIPSTKLSESNE